MVYKALCRRGVSDGRWEAKEGSAVVNCDEQASDYGGESECGEGCVDQFNEIWSVEGVCEQN